MTSYEYFDLEKAETFFKLALSRDAKFYEAYMMLGELYSKQGNYSLASENYNAAVNIDSSFYRPVFFSLANAEMMTGDYVNALRNYKAYLRSKGNSEKNILTAIRNIKNCEFAIEAMKDPVSFNPVNAGSTINTGEDEYWPSITADGQTLIFTRQERVSHYPVPISSSQEDFYMSFFSEEGSWSMAVNAGAPLNTRQNEGAQTLSSNGNYMYFTACDRPGGHGSCDIYFSAYRDGVWTMPYNLGPPVNSSAWESTPSISADGNLLFFSSNRKGGFGGKDLWYSVMDNKGICSPPVNLGNKVNTEGDEMSPFIHFDGRSLYFSSDGREGMGGFDIYMTTMKEDSTWSEPRNLGYPLNTAYDEMGLVIEANGQKAWFSSKRDNQSGKDIFYFFLDESIRPNIVSYLKGKVSDSETGRMLVAEYELINLSTNKVTVKNKTDDQGNFLVCLPSGFNYGINVKKAGYLFYSDNFMFEGEHPVMEPLIKRINLNPVKVGEKMLLSNVFYTVDSWQLKRESVAELDNLVELLKLNGDFIVEIGGYTDSTGTDEHNLILSKKRALSVVNYLIDNNISADRLRYKGYGNTSPIGDNITYEGRRINRRTEVKIIDRKK
ncbi:MAG: PD40 domain-containing protein [Bacteroidales bacterium]|nr:PD40 domain-containing protein [Bacteroidales bacterium]